MGKAEKPWTWEQIAKLRYQDKLSLDQQRVRERFIVDYGIRAQAALMAAGHEPGTYGGECEFPYLSCKKCPLDFRSKWCRGMVDGCGHRAMEVYSRMVKKLGRMPEEK